MRSLTEAQLRFEQAYREVHARPDWVWDAAPAVLKELKQVEQHINRIIDQWEESDGSGDVRVQPAGVDSVPWRLGGSGRTQGSARSGAVRLVPSRSSSGSRL
jgi:hypothetical protein